MVIIVTGVIGVGKTTVCQKLVETVRNQGYTCGGILTYKDATNHIIIEDIQSGEKEILASSHSTYNGPRTPRYSFNPEGIDFGIQAIDKGIDSDVLIIDEVGHLELRGEGFVKSLELIQTNKVKNSVIVIRKESLSSFLPQLDVVSPRIFETTVDNRNQLPVEIGTILAEQCR